MGDSIVSADVEQCHLSLGNRIGSSFVMQSPVAAPESELSADEVAFIFSFNSRVDIMRARRVCTAWRDAAKQTLVPLSDFVVNSVRLYNAMRVMSTALPNLQQLSIRRLGKGHKYIEGENPEEERDLCTQHDTTHGINFITKFKKLRVLHIYRAPLNGGYPTFFEFPLLQKLTIMSCGDLRVDLHMLKGLPSLKELVLNSNPQCTGNLICLIALKDALELVTIGHCDKVQGNFMDLAGFLRLRQLNLMYTTVVGDIQDIHDGDFPALEQLFLPPTVHGGHGYEFQLISDVPHLMHTAHHLLQRTPMLFSDAKWSLAFGWSLSKESPDWYARDEGNGGPSPPFRLRFIKAGSRLGWSWCSLCYHSCEINWLDPESRSDDCETYEEDLRSIEQCIDFYRGYHQPPNELDYRRLCER